MRIACVGQKVALGHPEIMEKFKFAALGSGRGDTGPCHG
jgi:hypothetical protein